MPTETNDNKPLTRFEAQRKLGLFAPLDYSFGILLAITWITILYWCLFGQPSAVGLVGAGLFTLSVLQVWVIVLAYRILVFILDVQADINLLPEASARIVIGYREGRSK